MSASRSGRTDSSSAAEVIQPSAELSGGLICPGYTSGSQQPPWLQVSGSWAEPTCMTGARLEEKLAPMRHGKAKS